MAILVSRFGRIMASGGGSSALGDAVAKPRDNRQKDLLRPGLEDIIDLGHALVRLAHEIDWQFLDGRFSSVCAPGPGQAWPADAAGGRAVHPQAHAQPVGPGFVRALAGEPVLPVLLWRIELLPRAAVRALVIDPPEPVEGGASDWARRSWWR